jgi:hypothetical protein
MSWRRRIRANKSNAAQLSGAIKGKATIGEKVRGLGGEGGDELRNATGIGSDLTSGGSFHPTISTTISSFPSIPFKIPFSSKNNLQTPSTKLTSTVKLQREFIHRFENKTSFDRFPGVSLNFSSVN